MFPMVASTLFMRGLHRNTVTPSIIKNTDNNFNSHLKYRSLRVTQAACGVRMPNKYGIANIIAL